MITYVVEYGDNEDGYLRHWNCKDSKVEAMHVYEYLKFVNKYVRVRSGSDILIEWRNYDYAEFGTETGSWEYPRKEEL